MIENFGQYWETFGAEYEKAGVSKLLAHKIWCDALDTTAKLVIKAINKKA